MKTYNSNSIYFGNLIYNTEDGYFFSRTECFEKDGENEYKYLGDDSKFKEFIPETPEAITVANLFPLSNILKDKEVTKTMINLYKIKYVLSKEHIKHFDEYNNSSTNRVENQKRKNK